MQVSVVGSKRTSVCLWLTEGGDNPCTMVGDAVREDGNVWKEADGPMETFLFVILRSEEARPEILVVHWDVNKGVGDAGLDYTVLDDGLGGPADGFTLAFATFDSGPYEVLGTNCLRRLNDILAMKLFRVISMFIELSNAINSPCPGESLDGFLKGA